MKCLNISIDISHAYGLANILMEVHKIKNVVCCEAVIQSLHKFCCHANGNLYNILVVCCEAAIQGFLQEHVVPHKNDVVNYKKYEIFK
jgi:hypothetical protein